MVSTPLLNWSRRRPDQLLRVRRAGSRYRFDFSLVKRWTDLARANGITHFEWMDLLTWWNAAFAARVYEGDPEEQRLLWRTKPDPTTPHYTKYAGQIGTVDCPDAMGPSRARSSSSCCGLTRFFAGGNLLDRSMFHIGDEPERENIHNYRKARQMFRELAPWMKIMDPFCWIDYAEPDLMDVRVPRTLCAANPGTGPVHLAYYCGNQAIRTSTACWIRHWRRCA